MSKQVLSIEQMKHLKELGVDTSKASMALIYTNGCGDDVDWDIVNEDFHKADIGQYNPYLRSIYGTFTLQDIIDLLPSNIEGCYIEMGKRSVSYSDYESARTIITKGRRYLIDAAYEMLCWCAEHGYKLNKI